MAYSKVILNGETLIDVTNDTVDAGNLLSGETATKNSGEKVTGNVTIPANIVNTVTTSAGNHTVITSATGDVTFNVPTKTSHLTNDSGFVTTDTKVTQSFSTSNTAQPILFRNNVDSGTGDSTDASRYVNTVTITPSSGNITATTFNGYTLAEASAKAVATSISAGSTSGSLPTASAVATFVEGKGYITSYTDTKNTAGSTDSSSKLFLIGATSQAANPQTYSHDTAYVGTDGCLYSGGVKVLTAHQDISGKADKSATVSNVAYDSTNAKITKTINGTTSDVVTVSTLKIALGSMPASDVSDWAKASTKPSYTASEVGAATSTHAHGNITNGGDITATAPTIASGDQIIINDHSASKITNGVTFDGSTTTTALTPKGTWESFSKFSGSYNDLTNKPTIPTVPSNVSAFTNDAGYITSADVPEGASAYTGTISAVSTTASNGTSNGFARGDHVHNITGTVVKSALGTGSGTTKFLREDGTWATPAYTTNTDAKLQVAAVTSGTTYYPIVGTGTTAATRQYDTTGFIYKGTNGTTSAVGSAQLTLGNSTASGTANNKQGQLIIYGSTAYAHTISGAPTAARTLTLPNATGTIALTSDIPSSLPASDVYDWAKASTKPTYTASEVGALASNTTYVSTVTTTAGAHTAISSKSGAVSFNVPTKTSHLTNDSGFITASHTSTYSLPLAASGTRGGVQIGYSESGTNYAVKLSSEKMYVSVPWTDTKVTTAALTSGTTYYPILATGTGTATRQIDSTLTGLRYVSTAGTTSTVGTAILSLGNTTASGSANNEQGVLRLYSSGATYYTDIKSSSASSHKTITLPNATGTVALTSDIPTVPTNVSAFTNDAGYLTGITSSQVTTALGYTPYNSTNPNGYTSNTGTVTKVTAGTGLSIGTTAGGNFTTSGTINHSNSVTAQTTQAVYPIKIDAQGHISGYGSAVTSMPASDVSSWAKATSKPTYTASEVGAVPTSRTVNGKALSADITLSASDVSALPSSTSILSTSPTLSSTGLTPYSSRCSITSGGIYTLGKWVFVQLELKNLTSLSANNTWGYLDGFPVPVTGGVAAIAVYASQNYGNISGQFNSSGRLVLATGGSALAADTVISVAGWYITS